MNENELQERIKEALPSCPICHASSGYRISGFTKDDLHCLNCWSKWFLRPKGDLFGTKLEKGIITHMKLEKAPDKYQEMIGKVYPFEYWQNLAQEGEEKAIISIAQGSEEKDEALAAHKMERNVRTKPLTGFIEESWKKDLKDIDLRGRLMVDIALDAERIVFGSVDELRIFNFDGAKERDIEVIAQGNISSISSIAVTSDCSRIFCGCTFRGFGTRKGILTYNPEGKEELEVETSNTEGEVIVSTSLDGKLFAANSDKRYMEIWDWNGNALVKLRVSRGLYIQLERLKYIMAPDGSYVAWNFGGGAKPPFWYVTRTPNIDDLLKISDVDERLDSDLWAKNTIPLENELYLEWNYSRASAANNRLTLFKERSICILDIIGNKYNILLCDHELVNKPEFISTAKMTSDGKYLYYISHNNREKRISFNIFDVEKETIMRDLLTFPTKPDVNFILSHDGSKLITITKKEVTMLNIS